MTNLRKSGIIDAHTQRSSKLSEDFWLRELKGLRPFVEDMIRSSEVMISEQFGPFNPKYHDYARMVYECACHLINLEVDGNIKQMFSAQPLSVEPLISDFMGYGNHTSLTSIIVFSELIKREFYGPIGDPYLAYIEGINESALLLLQACYDMFNILVPNQSPISIEELRSSFAFSR
jgi:hypothetical protein